MATFLLFLFLHFHTNALKEWYFCKLRREKQVLGYFFWQQVKSKCWDPFGTARNIEASTVQTCFRPKCTNGQVRIRPQQTLEMKCFRLKFHFLVTFLCVLQLTLFCSDRSEETPLRGSGRPTSGTNIKTLEWMSIEALKMNLTSCRAGGLNYLNICYCDCNFIQRRQSRFIVSIWNNEMPKVQHTGL